MSQVFYLRMTRDDMTLPVSPFGISLNCHMCGLFSVNGKLTFTQPLLPQQRCFLCSDLCDRDSILNDMLKLPVLRELIITPSSNNSKTAVFHHDFSQILWLDTKRTELRDIRLFLRDDSGQKLPVEDCLLHCTLLVFEKKSK